MNGMKQSCVNFIYARRNSLIISVTPLPYGRYVERRLLHISPLFFPRKDFEAAKDGEIAQTSESFFFSPLPLPNEAVSKVVFTAKVAKKTQRPQNAQTYTPAIFVLCEKPLRPLRLIFLTFNTSPEMSPAESFSGRSSMYALQQKTRKSQIVKQKTN